MAKQITFDRFLVIRCTAAEIMNAVGTSGCWCDDCGRLQYPSSKGYYIAVLNMWFCEKCFLAWTSRAVWYAEDADVERKNFEFYAPRLGVKCQKMLRRKNSG